MIKKCFRKVFYLCKKIFLSDCYFKALGDGPTCSQMGSGPDDMIMESPSGLMAMNPKYQWDKRGGVVRLPVVVDHAYSTKQAIHEKKIK